MFLMPLELFTQDDSFPFAVQYGGHDKNAYMHEHDRYSELVIVLDGSADHLVDTDSYRVRQGDVFVIGEGTAHGFTEPEHFRICNIMFRKSFLDLPDFDIAESPGFQALFVLEPHCTQQSRFRSRLRLSGEEFAEVRVLIDRMVTEFKGMQPGWKTMVRAQFLQLVGILSRLYRFDTQEPEDVLGLARAIAYIEAHVSEPITVPQIAAISHYSERQFNRLFRQTFECSPGVYIADLRLRSARSLLTATDLSVSEIAGMCGYPDSSYFSRIFKKHHRLTPTQYRAMQKRP